jgi:hypothetical protein
MKMGVMITTGFLAVLLITACGGGGGSDDDAPPPVEPLEATVIDESNAMEVAFSVLETIDLIGFFNSDDGILPLELSEPALSATTNNHYKTLSELIHWSADFLSATGGGSLIQSVAVELPPETLPCLVSGSVTFSASFADDTQQYLNPGDTVSTTFQQCNNGDGVVIDGGFRILILTRTEIDIDGNLVTPYSFGTETTFSDLALTELGETTRLSGSLELEEATADGVVFESHLASDQLSIAVNGDVESLRYFQLFGVMNDGNGSYTLEVRCEEDRCARLESSELEGFVDFRNLSPFQGFGNEKPFTGVLEVVGGVAESGIGPSRLEAEALNSGCVELRLDENGDGAVDWIQRTTWTSLATGIVDPC